MRLSSNFQFSQGSLQDYFDCPKRFQLKYVEQIIWPALETEPALDNEIYLRQGAAFHRLIQQFLLGVSEDKLNSFAKVNPNLEHWWENFLGAKQSLDSLSIINIQNNNFYPEIILSTPMSDFRLVGKFDLLVIRDGKFEIFDWKTSRKYPMRKWVENKLQTRVYPFLLVQAGSHLNGGLKIKPTQIDMVYWFANFPTMPIKFHYSDKQFNEDQKYLVDLIDEIRTLDNSNVAMTVNEKNCNYCVYRSFCNRGIQAGSFNKMEEHEPQDSDNFEFDFEQIAEIEF